MPRLFAIENDAGEKWDLNGNQGIFLYSPSGLGIKDELITSDLGYGFFRDLNNKKVPSEPIVGDLLFLPGNPYKIYRDFLSFVFNSKKLKILYRPYGTDTYYIDGRFEYLEKEELDKSGTLIVPFNFKPFTLWYRQKTLDLIMRQHVENDMTYPFEYSSNLVYGSIYTGSYEVEINPYGHVEAAIKFVYAGELENPILKLYGKDSEIEYGECGVTKSSVTGFSYSSVYNDCFVKDGSGEDLLNYISPEHTPYFRIPKDEACILRLIASNELTGEANVSVYYYFRSV